LFQAVGPAVGTLVQELHRLDGTDVRTSVTATDWDVHAGSIRAVELIVGTCLERELVVAAVGSDPAIGWLAGSGLTAEPGAGVVTDSALRCVVPGVVAAGDVVSWPNPAAGGRVERLEHWTSSAAQGRSAAVALLNWEAAKPFSHVPTFWSEQCGDTLRGAGWPHLADEAPVIRHSSDTEARFIAEYRRNSRLVGVVVRGSAADLVPYSTALRQRSSG